MVTGVTVDGGKEAAISPVRFLGGGRRAEHARGVDEGERVRVVGGGEKEKGGESRMQLSEEQREGKGEEKRREDHCEKELGNGNGGKKNSPGRGKGVRRREQEGRPEVLAGGEPGSRQSANESNPRLRWIFEGQKKQAEEAVVDY